MSVLLDVFGDAMRAEFAGGRWRLYRLGADGKRGDAGVVIPSFVTADELAQYLFDLLHEAARPSHPAVRRLADK